MIKSIIPFILAVLGLGLGLSQAYPFDVAISGKGKEAILFIPGFASSGQVWEETRAKFEKDFTCHTLTMPGFAGVPPQDDPSFSSWETDIAEYIRSNKINNPILVGHSMGGALAMAVAADYPDLVQKIVVVDALPCLAALMNPAFKSNPANDCTPLINQFTAVPDDQFMQMQKMSAARLVTDPARQAQMVQWSADSDRKTFAAMYCDFSNTDLREKISSISCPTLVLLEAGFKDLQPRIEEQYVNLKTAKFQYATKGLHFIMYDDQDWYLNQLVAFIAP